LSIIFKTMIRL